MRRFHLTLAVFAIAVILGSQIAQVEAAVTVVGQLPSGRYYTSAIWDGSNAYIFGGSVVNPVDDIVRFNPTTGSVTLMEIVDSNIKLPSARTGTSAIWDGSNAYIFGGSESPGYLDDIVRFNPPTGTPTILASTLPTARWWTSAIWDGSNAYIFGGRDSSGYLDDIVRFNPSTGVVTRMEDIDSSIILPTPRELTSAIWDGSNAYIFGGDTPSVKSDDIVRFNPSTGIVTLMEDINPAIKLPSGRQSMPAVWDGINAYIFGGETDSGFVNEIVQFNPTTGVVTVMTDTLPTIMADNSAVWGSAYIFGGYDDDDALDIIVKYDPPVIVGGYLVPANKLAVLMPYIALVGLVGVVSMVLVTRRRREA
jgi:hypothetical protein